MGIFSFPGARTNLAIIIPFILYFALVVGIGVYTTRYSLRGMAEFFLGGRQVGSRQVGK
jgi:Na+/proline symporter